MVEPGRFGSLAVRGHRFGRLPVSLGRRFMSAVELKETYFDVACKNLLRAGAKEANRANLRFTDVEAEAVA